MPVDEIFEGLFKSIGRLILQFVLEVVVELLIRGPGGFIAFLCLKKEPEIDGWVPIIFGLLFWFVLALLVYFTITAFGSNQNA